MPTDKGPVRLMLTREDERLVQRTMRWVAMKYQVGRDPQLQEELYHYGLVGLVEAKRSFRKERAIPFPAFAVHRIRGAMIDHLRAAPVIRVPQKQQELRRQLEDARQQLQRCRLEPSDEALAAELGWSLEEVRRVIGLQLRVVSLTAGTAPDDKDADRAGEGDIPSRNPGPEAGILKNELAVVVRQCLERIRSARDRMILVGRILHDRKLRELAACLDCSLETVRLRQRQALASMRRCLESQGWDEESLNDTAG